MVLGIGNALVDILFEIPNDDILLDLQLPKGSMQLVSQKQNKTILDGIKAYDKKVVSGGSASNTIRGIALLGGRAAYVGMIGNDELGIHFEKDMKNSNVETNLFRSEHPTGNASTFISKNGERTFATYLGAAIELSPKHISSDIFSGKDIVHIEGYLVQNHELVEKIVTEAKSKGLKISLDLASYNVVEDNKDFLQRIVTDYVDILFANEEEAKAFTGEEPEAALEILSNLCEYAIVKVGKEGSMIKHGQERVNIGIISGEVIDTTGAGDLYAAGFLCGLSNKYSLEKCGNIAKILAGNVVQVIGAQIHENQWNDIKKQIPLL